MSLNIGVYVQSQLYVVCSKKTPLFLQFRKKINQYE